MRVELFPFQKNAVRSLRQNLAMSLKNYQSYHIPQVISFTAPTGSGKTIIMAALFEDILFGSEDGFAEQPDAIIVWLSDSPQLNDQSRAKIDLKADKINLSQCVTITDEAFDQEVLDDGHIYFLNTQKIGKSGNLSKHGDSRQFTIWETLENTIKEKSDRLYFVIDEAHRGMQGTEAGKATSIMQRFIKGSPTHKLSPMPVVIGMSATSARFNKLVEGTTNSSIHKVVVTAQEVRASGLLKERIVIKYPENADDYNEMAVLQAAADEWKNKCLHWYQYSNEQHYAQVNPVFVIQVKAGDRQTVSKTDIGECVRKIEERTGYHFKEHEVVHTFGQGTDLTIGNMVIHYIEPSAIADDRRIRVVFFKENLSTGWDCPRAETMMSFRVAEDATYIAQLLGRMIRTPLQCRVMVDESLNDVHLFLPYFNADTVDGIINELQNAEGGEIPTVIDDEILGMSNYATLTSRPKYRPQPLDDGESLPGLFDTNLSAENTFAEVMACTDPENNVSINDGAMPPHTEHPVPAIPVVQPKAKVKTQESAGTQLNLIPEIDRPAIIKFINDLGLLTYEIRSVQIHNYLKSLIDLSRLLTHHNIYKNAIREVDGEIVDMIRTYVDDLKHSGIYDKLANEVLQFKLLAKIFDPFGEKIQNFFTSDLFATDAQLDYQLRAADRDLGSCGIPNAYMKKYYDDDDPNTCKIDVILFVIDENCMKQLHEYAEVKFHELNDAHRKGVVKAEDKVQNEYKKIIANGDPVSKHNFRLPEVLQVKCDKDGVEYSNHLFVDENTGTATFKFNSGWEPELLKEEVKKSDFVCWLRNIPRQNWSLCIPYEINGVTEPTFPDFIIIRADNQSSDGYVLDILEPHNPALKDNLGKAKGFAKYAEDNIGLGRFQLIRKESDVLKKKRFKCLDFSKGLIRQQVLAARDTDDIDHIFDEFGFFEEQ